MKLTVNALIEFEKWYIPYIRQLKMVGDRYYDETLLTQFYEWGDAMKYGVYVDWFDSVGIHVESTREEEEDVTYYESNVDGYLGAWKTRPQARTAAIQEANENYNNLK